MIDQRLKDVSYYTFAVFACQFAIKPILMKN